MPRGKRSSTDAIAILKQDHADVSALFGEFEAVSDEAEREAIATRICRMLTVHAICENELLYPAAHEFLAEENLVYEARVEHGSAAELIASIESMTVDDAAFAPTVKVLGAYVLHHVREEERRMFPRLRRTDIDLVAIGRAILARKDELAAELDASSSIPVSEDRADTEEEDYGDEGDDRGSQDQLVAISRGQPSGPTKH